MIMMWNQDASMMDPTWLNIIMTFVIVISTIFILILAGTLSQKNNEDHPIRWALITISNGAFLAKFKADQSIIKILMWLSMTTYH